MKLEINLLEQMSQYLETMDSFIKAGFSSETLYRQNVYDLETIRVNCKIHNINPRPYVRYYNYCLNQLLNNYNMEGLGQ